MSAAQKLSVVYDRWHGCTRCGLHTTRQNPNIFFGGGHPDTTKYLIICNAPTADDEDLEVVFAGRAALLLLESLESVGIELSDCYFTYAVSCRPKVFIPATDTEKERIEDRAPSRDEMAACRPRLYEIIYQVDPRAIITVGEWATKTVVRGRLPKFLEVVGQQYTCVLPAADPEDHTEGKLIEGKSRYHDIKYPVFAAPDTAAILINTSSAKHGPHNILLKTLARARRLVEFTLNAEAKSLESL